MMISFNISELLTVSKALAVYHSGTTATQGFNKALAVVAALRRAETVLCTPGVVYSESVRAAVYCRLINALDSFEDDAGKE